MPKIIISTSSFDLGSSAPLAALKSHGFEIILNPHGRRLTEAEVMELLQGVVGMIAGVEPLTRNVLERAKGLKVISRCGIGMDSVDLEAAGSLGIRVTNTPGAPVAAVAELTIALMLDLLRKVSQADRGIRDGKWMPLMGNLLGARTVGIVGYGRIGQKVAEILQAFGSKILVNDMAELPPHSHPGVEACSLDELMQRADVVSLHLPYNSSTHHLVNEKKIALMKPASIIINASRGGLIDELALFAALSSGRLAGAGLDTYEQEPYRGPLAALPQVVLTAHMGSYAKESRMQMEQEAAENLVRELVQAGVVPTELLDGLDK